MCFNTDFSLDIQTFRFVSSPPKRLYKGSLESLILDEKAVMF